MRARGGRATNPLERYEGRTAGLPTSLANVFPVVFSAGVLILIGVPAVLEAERGAAWFLRALRDERHLEEAENTGHGCGWSMR